MPQLSLALLVDAAVTTNLLNTLLVQRAGVTDQVLVT